MDEQFKDLITSFFEEHKSKQVDAETSMKELEDFLTKYDIILVRKESNLDGKNPRYDSEGNLQGFE